MALAVPNQDREIVILINGVTVMKSQCTGATIIIAPTTSTPKQLDQFLLESTTISGDSIRSTATTTKTMAPLHHKLGDPMMSTLLQLHTNDVTYGASFGALPVS